MAVSRYATEGSSLVCCELPEVVERPKNCDRVEDESKSGELKMKAKKHISVKQAAKLLKVEPRTIQQACKRFGCGFRLSVGTQNRVVLVLTMDDVKLLDRMLYRQRGRPTDEERKRKSDYLAR